jgi:hypothetical protein
LIVVVKSRVRVKEPIIGIKPIPNWRSPEVSSIVTLVGTGAVGIGYGLRQGRERNSNTSL